MGPAPFPPVEGSTLSSPFSPLPAPAPPAQGAGQSSHRRTTNGKGAWHGQPINWRQLRGMAPPPTGRRPLASEKAGLFPCFCCRPSLAEPSRETSRAQPNVAERSRAQPSPAPKRPPPPERRRASRRAASAAEEAPPQGEEVPARRRPPAAEAAPVAPPRERPAEAALPRGRVGGRGSHPCPPPAAPRPQAPEQQSAPCIPLPRTLPRARTGLNSGKRGPPTTGMGGVENQRRR